MRALLFLSAVLAANLMDASTSFASVTSFHLVKVKEVYPGSAAAPGAQYVLLQMPAPGENLVGGKQVRIHDAAGTVDRTRSPSPPPCPSAPTRPRSSSPPPRPRRSSRPPPPFTDRPRHDRRSLRRPRRQGLLLRPGREASTSTASACGGYTGRDRRRRHARERLPSASCAACVLRRRMDVCASPTDPRPLRRHRRQRQRLRHRRRRPAPRNNAGMPGVVPPVDLRQRRRPVASSSATTATSPPGDGCTGDLYPLEPSALAPQALVLDPAATAHSADGNRVFEPGRAGADVQPSLAQRGHRGLWLADIRRSCLLSAGPAGPTYSAVVQGRPVLRDGPPRNDHRELHRASGNCLRALGVSNPPSAAGRPTGTRPPPRSPRQLRLQDLEPCTSAQSFTDVPRTNPFYRFIETLLHRGVTGGCTPTTYCPAGATTRESMAVFVLVAKDGPAANPPACGTPVFDDVPASSPFCRWIEELARRGVVGGCGGGNYCPTAPVTREAMSVFALRTLDPLSTRPLAPRTISPTSRDQPVLPLDRGAVPPRSRERMRRRELLPDGDGLAGAERARRSSPTSRSA